MQRIGVKKRKKAPKSTAKVSVTARKRAFTFVATKRGERLDYKRSEMIF